jgi:acyl dehydratase
MEVKAGEKLPVLERRLELADLVIYAGATWDWYRMHYDPEIIARFGLPGALVDGQMLGALLAEHALDWAGPRAFIHRMAFRFKSMVFAGDTVRCEGEVSAVEGSRVTLTQRVVVGDRAAVESATTELDLLGTNHL